MVELKNINYSIGNNKIIQNINIKFEDEKITYLIGKNGSGKTTLLEIIDMLVKPDNGELIIDDKSINNIKEKELVNIRKNIGLVFQNPEEQFFCETVKKELEFGMNIFKYDKKTREKRIKDSLTMVGLPEEYLNRNPMSLSRSDMRKLSIACVLALNPKIILLDEPTINLDDLNKKVLIDLLKRLKRKYHKTIIITSHDMNFILKTADYIYVINNGEKVLEGNKYDVFKNEELLKYNILPPKIIEFSNIVRNTKNIKLEYRDDINDLMKDIYRHAK